MSNSITPITEDDIANFLVNTPDFFERHAQLLSSVRFVSPHGQRAVSLQERQADMLREKIRALEHRMMEMIRNGSDNAVLADRLHRWSQSLLMAQHPADLPSIIVDEIQHHFMVPQVAIRVWRVGEWRLGPARHARHGLAHARLQGRLRSRRGAPDARGPVLPGREPLPAHVCHAVAHLHGAGPGGV